MSKRRASDTGASGKGSLKWRTARRQRFRGDWPSRGTAPSDFPDSSTRPTPATQCDR
jgi:hypothetical protein